MGSCYDLSFGKCVQRGICCQFNLTKKLYVRFSHLELAVLLVKNAELQFVSPELYVLCLCCKRLL